MEFKNIYVTNYLKWTFGYNACLCTWINVYAQFFLVHKELQKMAIIFRKYN